MASTYAVRGRLLAAFAGGILGTSAWSLLGSKSGLVGCVVFGVSAAAGFVLGKRVQDPGTAKAFAIVLPSVWAAMPPHAFTWFHGCGGGLWRIYVPGLLVLRAIEQRFGVWGNLYAAIPPLKAAVASALALPLASFLAGSTFWGRHPTIGAGVTILSVASPWLLTPADLLGPWVLVGGYLACGAAGTLVRGHGDLRAALLAIAFASGLLAFRQVTMWDWFYSGGITAFALLGLLAVVAWHEPRRPPTPARAVRA